MQYHSVPEMIRDLAEDKEQGEQMAKAIEESNKFDGWPSYLVKATCNPFDYLAMVDGFGVVRFGEAEDLENGWVRLMEVDQGTNPTGFPLPHGVEVRVSDIRWIADGPNGI